jgi:regulator of RNase E activity RraA
MDENSQNSHLIVDLPARVDLPAPNVTLPIRGPDFARFEPAVIEALQDVSSATAAGILFNMGLRRSAAIGPRSLFRGKKTVGTALTLQFMPQREDVVRKVADDAGLPQEYSESRTALWAALEAIQPGDVLVVQAYGDPATGCLGEMLISYLRHRGGVGLVVDGSIRDSPKLSNLDIGIWSRGVTPNFASQNGLYPWAYQVPIACAGILVLPGDVVIADDDGAVMVPAALVPLLVESSQRHEAGEEFSRLRIAEGGLLSRYYPLVLPSALHEYEQWRALRDASAQIS